MENNDKRWKIVEEIGREIGWILVGLPVGLKIEQIKKLLLFRNSWNHDILLYGLVFKD